MGLFLRGGPLPPGCWFEDQPTKKPPRGGEVLSGGGGSYDQVVRVYMCLCLTNHDLFRKVVYLHL